MLPHASEADRLTNRSKIGHNLVYQKIMNDCALCITSNAKRGVTSVTFCIPYMKPGYPAYNVEDVRMMLLYCLLKKDYNALPFKKNLVYIDWGSRSMVTRSKGR